MKQYTPEEQVQAEHRQLEMLDKIDEDLDLKYLVDYSGITSEFEHEWGHDQARQTLEELKDAGYVIFDMAADTLTRLDKKWV